MVDRLAVSGFFAEWMLENPTQEASDFIQRMAFMTPDSIAALLNTVLLVPRQHRRSEGVERSDPAFLSHKGRMGGVRERLGRGKHPKC